MVYIYCQSVYLLVILVTGLSRISKRIAYGNSKVAVNGIEWSLCLGYVLRQNKLLPNKVWLRHKSCYRSLIGLHFPLLMGGIFRHSP